MDNALNALISWQFLLFCLGTFTITFIIRKIVEFYVKSSLTSPFWNELFIPIMPPILGALVGLCATKYTYPDGLNNLSGRLFFGMVAGLLSGLVYKVVKGTLKAKLATLGGDTDAPAVVTASVLAPTSTTQPIIVPDDASNQ